MFGLQFANELFRDSALYVIIYALEKFVKSTALSAFGIGSM